MQTEYSVELPQPSQSGSVEITRVHIPDAHVCAQDRSIGHRFLMSRIADHILDAQHPRQDAGLLWAPEMVDRQQQALLVCSRAPLDLSSLEHEPAYELRTGGFVAGEQLWLELELERTYVPFVAPPEGYLESFAPGEKPTTHGKRVPVDPADTEHLQRWTRAKLERAGLAPAPATELGIRCFRTRVGKRVLPAVSVTGSVIVIDPQGLAQICVTGLGRSKNYGMGLVRLR